jgi:hypothetical protein
MKTKDINETTTMQNDYEIKVFESPTIGHLALDLLEELRRVGYLQAVENGQQRQAVRVTEALCAELNLFRYLSAKYKETTTRRQ